MLCRNCGELVRRSRPRNTAESFIKQITPFQTYRCKICGWRGLLAGGRPNRPSNLGNLANLKRTAILWALAVILALGIGGFGAMQIQSSANPSGRPTVVR